jgi:hypothetical protein
MGGPSEAWGTEEERALEGAVARALEGELRAVGEALAALPRGHRRRRLLRANYRVAVALIGDIRRILAAR